MKGLKINVGAILQFVPSTQLDGFVSINLINPLQESSKFWTRPCLESSSPRRYLELCFDIHWPTLSLQKVKLNSKHLWLSLCISQFHWSFWWNCQGFFKQETNKCGWHLAKKSLRGPCPFAKSRSNSVTCRWKPATIFVAEQKQPPFGTIERRHSTWKTGRKKGLLIGLFHDVGPLTKSESAATSSHLNLLEQYITCL